MKLSDTPAWMDRLGHSQLFHEFPEKALQSLLSAGSVIQVAAGTTLVKEGDTSPALHVILDGYVQVSRSGKPVAQMGRGSFFGEMSLFGMGLDATAAIFTPQPCVFFNIKRAALEGWFRQNPDCERIFFRKLASELCNRLYATTDKLATKALR